MNAQPQFWSRLYGSAGGRARVGRRLPFLRAAAEPPASPAASHGLDLTALDRSVDPGDDFYAFANGAWLKRTEIPGDRSTWGPSEAMTEETAQRTRQLLEEAAPRGAGRGHGAAAGGGLLRQLHGRSGDRGERAGARQGDAGADCGHRVGWRTCRGRSARRCAPTWTRSTPPTSTPTVCSASG
jgi:hypothetical protein